MKVSGTYKHYSVRQRYFRRHRTLSVTPTDSQLTKDIWSEGVYDTIHGQCQGVRVTGADAAHNHAEQSRDQGRRDLFVGVTVAQLTVDSPTPRKYSAVSGKRHGVILPGHCVDNNLLRQWDDQLWTRTLQHLAETQLSKLTRSPGVDPVVGNRQGVAMSARYAENLYLHTSEETYGMRCSVPQDARASS